METLTRLTGVLSAARQRLTEMTAELLAMATLRVAILALRR